LSAHCSTPVEVTAIIPVGRRRSDLGELYADYKEGLKACRLPFEMIFVVDGPSPEVLRQLRALVESGEQILIIELARRFGEAAAVNVAFSQATGRHIVILPAYAQVQSSAIATLLDGLSAADVTIGVRTPRSGGFLERLRRRAFHSLLAAATRWTYRDLGCNARALHRRVLEHVHIYADQLRFLPILATRQGFRVVEVEVRQSPRDARLQAYGLREYFRWTLDLFTVFFLVRFTKTPLRFFGSVGAGAFLLGSAGLLWIIVERLFLDEPLSDRPALVLTTMLIVLGVLLFALGLLCELVIFTNARHIKDYQVSRIVGTPSPDPEQSHGALDR
jgi:glycosyltransferase involved in cell wall biosynthesis